MKAFLRERAKPRDIFFFLIGCVIAYHEVFLADEAEPLLIFTVLFLWGLIPAFWGDRAPDRPPTPPGKPPSPPAHKDDAPDQLTLMSWNRTFRPA